VLFAIAAVPMIGAVGLAVDYGIWNQTNATLTVAANVAALTAVKIAANAQLAGDTNALTEGQVAGQQWFLSEVGANSQIGTKGLTLSPAGATVTVTGGATVTATVAYNGYLPSVFGNLLAGVGRYWVSGHADAQVTSAPYLNIEMLLDNSSSMDIGATVTDMANLQQISACDPSNAVYTAGGTGNSLDPFNSYGYSGSGQTYADYIDSNGSFPGPLTAPVVLVPPSGPHITVNQGSTGPKCDGYPNAVQNGVTPTAGPPCEFACHWDSSANSGLANDLYGAARRTIGTPNAISLRFDLVKIATNHVLTAMQTDDLAINNLNVGIFTFNTTLKRVYPTSGEAGDDWTTAISDVGLPPTGPYVAETGIQPVVGLRQNQPNDDTDIVDAMSTLQSQDLPTPSGDGTTSASPRKVLFLITDGFMDDNSRGRSAFPTSLCTGFKNLGYTIYVVFTPYYPVMHTAYLGGYGTIINGSTSQSGTLAYGLAQCASSASDIISAANLPQLDAALQKFLVAALTTPAKFTH
jgi:Flp pilus assembly protein TadG